MLNLGWTKFIFREVRKEIFALFLFVFANCTDKETTWTDYALLSMKDNWLHHPVLGDPSFDQFRRSSVNPLLRGTPPLEWPVNGSRFEDPATGNEYVYAGVYPRNYAIGAKNNPLAITDGCVAFCSSDQGKTWKNKGPIFADTNFILEGERKPISFAPDVSVVYHEGKYYAGFDYVTSEFSWSGNNLTHSGLAVAVADSPEGPFRIFKKPAISCSYFFDNPVFGKYNRCYAGTLLKTTRNWVMVFMLDSGPNYSWALAAISAPTPEGPWSEPVLIKSVEDAGYYPSLMEFFPAFMHHDSIFAPATSVALNRNFQTILSVPAADVMRPEKWKLQKEGSLWHSENNEYEFAGIWGQTFGGYINEKEQLRVIFPSLDSSRNGTINLASVAWNDLYRKSGFILTGSKGASVSTLHSFYHQPEINADFTFYGTIAVLMNAIPPLGPNTPKADATLHPLVYSNQARIQLSAKKWWLLQAGLEGKTDTLGAGSFDKRGETNLKVSYREDVAVISIDDRLVWKGKLKGLHPGRVGLMALPHSGIDMRHFRVSGRQLPGSATWLYTEGLLNAGNNPDNWTILNNDSLFRFGTGAVAKKDSARAKWSFVGSGFDLWAPGTQDAGTVQVLLNGKHLADVDLQTETPQKSRIICSLRNLPQKNNALVIKGIKGKIVLDCLIVYD